MDFDEIKRRKRQSPFTKNQSEEKIISETMEAFKDALKNEEIERSKIHIHREKRQLMANITMNSRTDLELPRALPKKEEEPGNYQCSSFLIWSFAKKNNRRYFCNFSNLLETSFLP